MISLLALLPVMMVRSQLGKVMGSAAGLLCPALSAWQCHAARTVSLSVPGQCYPARRARRGRATPGDPKSLPGNYEDGGPYYPPAGRSAQCGWAGPEMPVIGPNAPAGRCSTVRARARRPGGVQWVVSVSGPGRARPPGPPGTASHWARRAQSPLSGRVARDRPVTPVGRRGGRLSRSEADGAARPRRNLSH
eukprot:2495-Hanusia_phi.AAC.1